MDLLISEATAWKLRNKHKVTPQEVLECFDNRTRETIIDDREQHRSIPPTEWFIAKTNADRKLKVVFIPIVEDKVLMLRTAYPPNKHEERIYDQET